MSILEIIRHIGLQQPMIVDFIHCINVRKFENLSYIRLDSKMLKDILANIAAEKCCLEALIFAEKVGGNMDSELTCLATGSGYNFKRYSIRSPLYWACYHRNLEILQFLINSRAILPRLSNERKNDPIFIAIQQGFHEGVKLLLTSRYIYTTSRDNNFHIYLKNLLQEMTIATLNKEIQVPFQIETIEILNILLSHPENKCEHLLGEEHKGFIRYVKKRSFVIVRHYFIRSYSNISELFTVENSEIGNAVLTESLSKKGIHNILLYEILCNIDLTKVIAEYI